MQSSTSLPGAHIGKYRLLALIATGGMGRVYKAKDEQLGRIVALKILAPELSHNQVLVERFRREARHAASLTHKNIVTLYEADEADGYHYLAMEFVEGIDLAEYIRRKGKLQPEESRRVLIQACKALEHAFEMGITHRDIKPSNFLLANDEGRTRVKLTDLGLSRMQNDEEFRVTTAGASRHAPLLRGGDRRARLQAHVRGPGGCANAQPGGVCRAMDRPPSDDGQAPRRPIPDARRPRRSPPLDSVGPGGPGSRILDEPDTETAPADKDSFA